MNRALFFLPSNLQKTLSNSLQWVKKNPHVYVQDIKSLQNRYIVRRLLWNDKDELNLPLAGSRFVIRDSSTGHRFSLIPAEGKIQLLETSHLVVTMFEHHIKAHLSNIKSSAFLSTKGIVLPYGLLIESSASLW